MNKIFILILTVCCSLTSTCNAQGFAKVARSITKSIGDNKAIIIANALRVYPIQEQQRPRIAPSVVRQTFPSTPLRKSLAVANAKCAGTNKASALLVHPRLQDVTQLPKGILPNDTTLIPMDTTYECEEKH